jgi:thioredoxin-related protein
MLYFDYHLNITPTGVILDEELTLSKLPGFKPGDVFVLEEHAGKVYFKKVSGLEKMVLEYALGQKETSNG